MSEAFRCGITVDADDDNEEEEEEEEVEAEDEEEEDVDSRVITFFAIEASSSGRLDDG